MATKKTWMTTGTGVLVLCLAVGASGCEVLGPLLFAEATSSSDDSTPTTAPLLLEVESASGVIADRELRPDMLVPRGDRIDQQLQFLLTVPEDQVELSILVSQAETSNINPYTGDRPGGELPPEGRPIGEPLDAGLPTSGPAAPFSSVSLCVAGACRTTEDFTIQIEQTESGRRAVVQGSWDSGESARIVMRYSEGG